MTDRCRRVGAHLVLQVHEPLRLMLQVAVFGMAPARIEERLQVSCDGEPLDVTEVQIAARAAFTWPIPSQAPSR